MREPCRVPIELVRERGSMIEIALCVECGTDTTVDGYVNRVSRDTGIIDGYNCGRCEEAYEDAQIWYDKAGKIVGRGAEGEELANSDEFERSIDDKVYEKYEKERHAEIDAMFPDAPAFREWCQRDTNETLSAVQIKEVQELVDNYRYNEDTTLAPRNTVGGVLENLLRRN
tara:strand:+ start:334 stop:846 length:513 start_codon:yes stop_codon:yes gene_type:complete